ncbi:MAG TPA: hypothetical protein DD412_03325 [Holosporales bacterium]|nr:hypothetical protein [Holosporales bacterium]
MKNNLIKKSAISLSLILGIFTVCNASETSEVKVTAVLKHGLGASTSPTSKDNPRPILMHLNNSENIPLEWQSDLKNAAMLGKCHGDLSSEKVICRIHALTIVKSDGSILEREVDAWIVDEDGLLGLRGKVFDRAKKERKAFLEVMDAIKERNLGTEFSKEESSARAKVFDYCKQYVELLSPVVSIDAGQVVNVVFKNVSDLDPTKEQNEKTNVQ